MRGRALTASSLLLVVLGLALVGRTVQAGAGLSFALGYLLGGGIVVAGIGRLYLLGAAQGRRAGDIAPPELPDATAAANATVVEVAPDGSFEFDGVRRGSNGSGGPG